MSNQQNQSYLVDDLLRAVKRWLKAIESQEEAERQKIEGLIISWLPKIRSLSRSINVSGLVSDGVNELLQATEKVDRYLRDQTTTESK